MRKFQIVSDCGRMGVKEDGAEGGWGDGSLEFNESNVGGTATSFEGNGGFSAVRFEKPKAG